MRLPRFHKAVAIGASLAMALVTLASAHANTPSAVGKPSQPTMQQIAEGSAIFDKRCVVCHGPGAKGGEGPALRSNMLTRVQILQAIKEGFPGDMPAFGKKLPQKDINRLADFVGSMSRHG